jgi:hypothetical protein
MGVSELEVLERFGTTQQRRPAERPSTDAPSRLAVIAADGDAA